MLDTATLRQIIKEIYNLDDDCIKAITTNWFLPEITNDIPEIIVGYRILSKKKICAENSFNKEQKDCIRSSFRLTFVGENAEQFADQIHFWQDNKDVMKIFDKYKIKLNSYDMTAFTYPIKAGKCEMAWIWDMSANSDYHSDLKLSKANRKSLKATIRSLIPQHTK